MVIYGKKKEIHIRGNGKILELMDGVFIKLKMGHFLEGNGLWINKMVLGLKEGLEVVFFLENIIWETKMG